MPARGWPRCGSWTWSRRGADEVRVLRAPASSGYEDVTVERRGEAVSPVTFTDLVLRVDDLLG